MSVNTSLTSLSSLYALLATSQAAPTSASAPASTTTSQTDGTIADKLTLDANIAQEQMAYLTQMQAAFQSGLVSSGIVEPDVAPLIFGRGTTSVLSLLGTPSTADSQDGLIVTSGLSDLAVKVLTGQTSLESVISHSAGTSGTGN